MEGVLQHNPESKKHFEIRRAEVEDADGIQDVFYKTWLATYPNKEHGITVDDIEDRLRGTKQAEWLAKRKEQIQSPAPNEVFLVAKDNQKIVGVVRALCLDERNQLQAIYVLPEFQGKGIGNSLWQKANDFFRPSFDTYVEVATYNKKAIDFYTKLGFVDTGRRWSDEKFRMKSGSILPQMEMVKRAKRTKN